MQKIMKWKWIEENSTFDLRGRLPDTDEVAKERSWSEINYKFSTAQLNRMRSILCERLWNRLHGSFKFLHKDLKHVMERTESFSNNVSISLRNSPGIVVTWITCLRLKFFEGNVSNYKLNRHDCIENIHESQWRQALHCKSPALSDGGVWAHLPMCDQPHSLRHSPPSCPFAKGNEGLFGGRRMLQELAIYHKKQSTTKIQWGREIHRKAHCIVARFFISAHRPLSSTILHRSLWACSRIPIRYIFGRATTST